MLPRLHRQSRPAVPAPRVLTGAGRAAPPVRPEATLLAEAEARRLRVLRAHGGQHEGARTARPVGPRRDRPATHLLGMEGLLHAVPQERGARLGRAGHEHRGHHAPERLLVGSRGRHRHSAEQQLKHRQKTAPDAGSEKGLAQHVRSFTLGACLWRGGARNPATRGMGLTLDELEEIQAEALADDVEIDLARMQLWVAEEARAYFESGGTVAPAAPTVTPPNAPSAAASDAPSDAPTDGPTAVDPALSAFLALHDLDGLAAALAGDTLAGLAAALRASGRPAFLASLKCATRCNPATLGESDCSPRCRRLHPTLHPHVSQVSGRRQPDAPAEPGHRTRQGRQSRWWPQRRRCRRCRWRARRRLRRRERATTSTAAAAARTADTRAARRAGATYRAGRVVRPG